jgi:bifunctional oligoribonuclease and PAP phosphatase NrnA
MALIQKNVNSQTMEHLQITELNQLLATPKKITIIPHRGPDGDAMGSTLALYHFLKKLNPQHQAIVLAPNGFPDFLEWLPGAESVVIFEKNIEIGTQIIQSSDLIFTLDFSAFNRVGEEMAEILRSVNKTFVMIDHHEEPEAYAKYMYSDTSIGSTCEMIYNFIAKLGKQSLLDKTIGTCIYTGILTDSGSFRFPRTTGATHRIVAELVDLGVENTKIPALVFESSSYQRLQILGRALQNIKLLPQYNTTYTYLSQEELSHFDYVKGDTEGIVNFGLSIKGINFTAIFVENEAEGIIKISFRSRGDFDVAEFSRNHFDGGGHINAAGGRSTLSLQETLAKFESILEDMNQ